MKLYNIHYVWCFIVENTLRKLPLPPWDEVDCRLAAIPKAKPMIQCASTRPTLITKCIACESNAEQMKVMTDKIETMEEQMKAMTDVMMVMNSGMTKLLNQPLPCPITTGTDSGCVDIDFEYMSLSETTSEGMF